MKQKNFPLDTKDNKKRYNYNFRNVTKKLVFLGIGVFLGCTVVGIAISQFIGWVLKSLLGQEGWFFDNDYFSNFFGGAIGLVVGFILDKICIDKINNVSKCKNFIISVKHEIDKIYSIMTNEEHNIVLKKQVEEQGKIIQSDVIIQFVKDKDGKYYVSTDITNCIGYEKIEELIFDDLVTSVEAMSLISSLPFAKRDFVNQLVDFLGMIHRLICEYNESLDEAERLYIEIQNFTSNELGETDVNTNSCNKKTEKLVTTLKELKELYIKVLLKKFKLNCYIKQLTLNEKEINIIYSS